MGAKIYIAIITMVILCSVGIVFADYVQDAPERVKAADWSKLETIAVYLDEFSFQPSGLVLLTGVPYKLEIINKGAVKHYFTAEDFFKAIATRKVQSVDGEIKAPYFTALEVFPGHSLDLYFIPVEKGSYGLQCTIKGHAEKGMVGQIWIE